MADLSLKRGDLHRPIVRRLKETLIDEDAGTVVTQPINLAGANSVKLLLKDFTGGVFGVATGGGNCTITNAGAGEVTYLTATADTANVRVWAMEYEITWAAGTDIETVPNQNPSGHSTPFYTLEIVQDLG